MTPRLRSHRLGRPARWPVGGCVRCEFDRLTNNAARDAVVDGALRAGGVGP